MDLAVILQAALSPNPDERKGAEQRLDEMQYVPQHPVSLFQIIVDTNRDMAVRQVAAIHFKNFVAKNWSPDHHAKISVSPDDKLLLRNHILLFLPQLPPLLRVQLGECLKTVIHSDYPEQFPHLLDWIKQNLQDQQQVHAALFVLRILSRKYEFKSDEERMPVYGVVQQTFPLLLTIFNAFVQIPNPSIEVADLIKLICKIFWSSIYLEVPKQRKEMGKAVGVGVSACDMVMRVLAFMLTLVAAIVISADKQTKVVPIQLSDSLPPFYLPLTAKWHQMSAVLYFLVTNAIACTYAALSLVLALVNRGKSKGLWTVITVLDAFMVALLFSGNGAAAAVGVLGYKGNSHVNWKRVCNVFEKFCDQMAASIGVSLIGSLAFLLLVIIPVLRLHPRT